MNINWKAKSAAFGVIDTFGLHGLLYFMQKHVTGRSLIRIGEVDENWRIHQGNLASLEAPRLIEFGAGKSLAQNIFLSQFAGSQTVVDLNRMLDLSQFNEAAAQISRFCSGRFPSVGSEEDLRASYRIDYRAPFDMRTSGLPEASFDGSVSTNTLEHIPRDAIIDIFRELKRIIRPGGVVSAIVDYSDHYAHTDRSISRLNFLSYSEEEFARHNHGVHYQNRLRHYDFEDVFRDLGFTLLRSDPSDFEPLPARLASQFDRRRDSLAATKGVFLLRVD